MTDGATTDGTWITPQDLARLEKLFELLTQDAPTLRLSKLANAFDRHPRLLAAKPETLARNVEATAQRLDLTVDAYVACALHSPPLFYQSPATVDDRVTALAAVLHVDRRTVIKAGIRSAGLFTASPETVFGRITELEKLLSLPRADIITLAIGNPSTLLISPSALQSRLADIAVALDAPFEEVIHAATRAGTILSLTPTRIKTTLDRLIDGLGFEPAHARRLWRRSPHILTRDPDLLIERFHYFRQTIPADALRRIVLDTASLLEVPPDAALRRFDELSGLFGISTPAVISLVAARPSIANYAADTLRGNIAALAQGFGVSSEAVITAALKSPDLITALPSTILSNITGIASRLALSNVALVAAVLRHPHLATACPDALLDRAVANAGQLGLSLADFAAMALRAPTLFSLTPANVALKIVPLTEFARMTGTPDGLAGLLKTSPAALTYSTQRIEGRLALAKAFPGRFAASVLLSMAQRKAELLLGTNPNASVRDGE